MKLLQNLLTVSFFALLTACGGGEKTEEKKDTLQTEEPKIEEKTEEPKMELTEDAKMLVKKWQMVSFTHTDGKKEDNIDDAFLELNEDGSFIEIFKGQTIATGKWMLSEDKKSLTFKHETGEFKDREKKEEVKEMGAEKLVTSDDDGKMIETYVPAKK